MFSLTLPTACCSCNRVCSDPQRIQSLSKISILSFFQICISKNALTVVKQILLLITGKILRDKVLLQTRLHHHHRKFFSPPLPDVEVSDTSSSVSPHQLPQHRDGQFFYNYYCYDPRKGTSHLELLIVPTLMKISTSVKPVVILSFSDHLY